MPRSWRVRLPGSLSPLICLPASVRILPGPLPFFVSFHLSPIFGGCLRPLPSLFRFHVSSFGGCPLTLVAVSAGPLFLSPRFWLCPPLRVVMSFSALHLSTSRTALSFAWFPFCLCHPLSCRFGGCFSKRHLSSFCLLLPRALLTAVVYGFSVMVIFVHHFGSSFFEFVSRYGCWCPSFSLDRASGFRFSCVCPPNCFLLVVVVVVVGSGWAGMGDLCVCRLNYLSFCVHCLLIVACLLVFLLHMTIMFYVGTFCLGSPLV